MTSVGLKAQITKRDSLIAISKLEFEIGMPLKNKRYYDKTVQKKANGKLVIPNCSKVFIDDTTDDNFVEYEYVGDLDMELKYKVVKETWYNGETYHILSTKLNYQSVHLLGEPKLFGKLIVNCNTSETTDKQPIIEVWRIENQNIKKIITINLWKFSNDWIDVELLRISEDRKIIFKDFNGKYWKLNFNL